MSHWMREELARGEGMRTCNHFATASKMSVVEFEGSVSEATTCKRTCVCLRYRLDGVRCSGHRCFGRTRSWSSTLPRQVLFGCFAMILSGFWRVRRANMLTVGSSDIWHYVREPARPLRDAELKL